MKKTGYVVVLMLKSW